MKNSKIVRMTLTAVLVAIMLIMDFTPLGYIVMPTGFSITLMNIPVTIGAVVLGPWVGALLGGVFGLTSFLQAFGIGYMIDPSAAVLFETSPLAMIATCLIPRILMGALVGLIYMASKRLDWGGMAISSFAAPVLNTSLFITFYILLYRNTVLAGTAIVSVIVSLLTLNTLVEIIASMLIGTALCKAVDAAVKRIK